MIITESYLRKVIRETMLRGFSSFIYNVGIDNVQKIAEPGISNEECMKALENIIKGYDGKIKKSELDLIAMTNSIKSVVKYFGFLIPKEPNEPDIDQIVMILKRLNASGVSQDTLQKISLSASDIVDLISDQRPDSNFSKNRDIHKSSLNRLKKEIWGKKNE